MRTKSQLTVDHKQVKTKETRAALVEYLIAAQQSKQEKPGRPNVAQKKLSKVQIAVVVDGLTCRDTTKHWAASRTNATRSLLHKDTEVNKEICTKVRDQIEQDRQDELVTNRNHNTVDISSQVQALQSSSTSNRDLV